MISRTRIDVLAGCFVILVGVLAMIEAMNFELGSARRMGPGYFPFYIGLFLILVGGGIVFEQRLTARGNEPSTTGLSWKPLLLILAAVGCFALTIERFGLLPAVAVSVFLATLADSQTSMRHKLILTVAVPIVCALIFWLGLDIQVHLLRWQP